MQFLYLHLYTQINIIILFFKNIMKLVFVEIENIYYNYVSFLKDRSQFRAYIRKTDCLEDHLLRLIII